MRNKDLSKLKVLVVNVHTYGNVGDHLETAPLFHKLHEWGVGTVDAHIAEYSTKMCKAHNLDMTVSTGQPYLCEPYVRNVFTKFPTDEAYDLVIYAPGPSCCIYAEEQFFDQISCDVVFFGLSYSESDIAFFRKQLESGCQKIKGIVAREPRSWQNLKCFMAQLEKGTPEVKLPSHLMSGDLSFSYHIAQDINSRVEYAPGYELVVLRARWKAPFQFKTDSVNRVIHNGSGSASFSIMKDGKLTHSLSDNIIVATTDRVADAGLMKQSASQLPGVPHVVCATVEELHMLVRGASKVYSSRYHVAIMAICQGKPLTVLPHWETEKMSGAELLDKGIREGRYKLNNDEAWDYLYELLP